MSHMHVTVIFLAADLVGRKLTDSLQIRSIVLVHKGQNHTGCWINNNMSSVMYSELLRLLSFKDSNQKAFAIRLAHEGFYFDRESGQTRCFSCGSDYNSQTASTSLQVAHNQDCRREDFDKPMYIGTRDLSLALVNQHVSRDSRASSTLSGAKNLGQSGSHQNGSRHGSVDETDPEHSKNLLSENEQLPHSINLPSDNGRPSPTCDLNNGPSVERRLLSTQPTLDLSLVSYPQFSLIQARIATFRGHSTTNLHATLRGQNATHLHEYLADAGFFHTDKSDRIRCFSCGLELKIGGADEVITTAHARLRPSCAYIQLLRGQVGADGRSQAHQTQKDVFHHTTGENSLTSTTVAGATSTDVAHVNDDVYGPWSGLSHPEPVSTEADHQQMRASQDLAEELRVVEREHELLADVTTCRICRSKPISLIFLPCGHVVACQGCADKCESCTFCGKLIVGTANVFLA